MAVAAQLVSGFLAGACLSAVSASLCPGTGGKFANSFTPTEVFSLGILMENSLARSSKNRRIFQRARRRLSFNLVSAKINWSSATSILSAFSTNHCCLAALGHAAGSVADITQPRNEVTRFRRRTARLIIRQPESVKKT